MSMMEAGIQALIPELRVLSLFSTSNNVTATGVFNGIISTQMSVQDNKCTHYL